MKLLAAIFFFAISTTTLFSQPQAPPAPPQTARQALLEMITGGQQAAMRHLTVEMQQSLKAKGNKSFAQELAVLDQMKAGSAAFQTFDAGQILLSINEPGTNEKIEVHVDSDDLSGDTDNIDLSFHQFRDGVEQDTPYTDLLSHFTLGMKKQENIWRLNEIAIGIKIPVGDPAWLAKMDKMGQGGMTGGKIAVGERGKPEAPEMTAEQAVMMLGFAEQAYAQQHPDAGFTCSLAELGKSPSFNLDERIFKGEPVNGYKFSLSACQGKPVESFHLIAEPLAPGAGTKAFCTDATRNIRSSDDGRGATCLTSGKARNAADATAASWSGDAIHLSK